jgi:hypothetical protein
MDNAGDHEHRAGRYIAQPAGYRAFISAPLPPDPPVALGADLQALLSRADYALGRLDGAVLTLPNPDLFVLMYVRKEAVLSSQIEGRRARCRTCSLPRRPSSTPSDPPMSTRSSTTCAP